MTDVAEQVAPNFHISKGFFPFPPRNLRRDIFAGDVRKTGVSIISLEGEDFVRLQRAPLGDSSFTAEPENIMVGARPLRIKVMVKRGLD